MVKGKWALEQAAAESKREAARALLKTKGQVWENAPEDVVRANSATSRDNTLEAVRKRKANDLLNKQVGGGNPARGVSTSSAKSAVVNETKLPQGWSIVSLDGVPRTGADRVFWHAGSGCTTYVRPEEESKDACEMANIQLGKTGWKVIQDPESSKFYYWNIKTNKVYWHIPAGEDDVAVPVALEAAPAVPEAAPEDSTAQVPKQETGVVSSIGTGSSKVEAGGQVKKVKLTLVKKKGKRR
uniref:WW domain-containing protein n=1 Tax=Mucochytrium quahogii TaxID=96639 RepID=A0A7S2WNS7_9STRA|mmetsp:Transcript_17878/g.28988  ORF Transcript_17878/g.28988 Transcript_17878/m.28988 type:complete len:241 (+) Transcript_17878:171-893(+)|eukprot:CAMPEP_0203753534 /NCGR_PEP_ID=MMETSP0098-20131031/7291_1 /ASSEMBLY_ACC=CAM_ASM_000208 /TAXON_ID=96639 /ORGANISM=" , Strain NY0313808BC1" /LENGTH=240 /DNA_ID=CAMNT_0050644177 /DNA_START=91 /DNA_END=813 /DNA_ORIENTATION=-